MKLRAARIILAAAAAGALAAGSGSVLAQQGAATRNFEAEIRAALQSAKTAAGFDFLGTLVRTCLLPQSGGENTRDNVPGYVTNSRERAGARHLVRRTRRRSSTTSTSSAARCTRPGR